MRNLQQWQIYDEAQDQAKLRLFNLNDCCFTPPAEIMLVPLFFCLHLPVSLGSTRTFYNELDTGPLKSSPHKALQGSQGPLKSSPHKALSWPYSSYPPPLPLWALGPKSPYKPRRMFVPYFGLSWSTTTTTTTTTTTERPYVPFSTCEHLPSYCSSYFSLGSTKPLPIQARTCDLKYKLAI